MANHTRQIFMHSSEMEELICILSATSFFLVVKIKKNEFFFNFTKVKSHSQFLYSHCQGRLAS